MTERQKTRRLRRIFIVTAFSPSMTRCRPRTMASAPPTRTCSRWPRVATTRWRARDPMGITIRLHELDVGARAGTGEFDEHQERHLERSQQEITRHYSDHANMDPWPCRDTTSDRNLRSEMSNSGSLIPSRAPVAAAPSSPAAAGCGKLISPITTGVRASPVQRSRWPCGTGRCSRCQRVRRAYASWPNDDWCTSALPSATGCAVPCASWIRRWGISAAE